MTDKVDVKLVHRIVQQAHWELSTEGPATGPLLTDERLLAAIHGRQPLTAKEHDVLMRSADTQEQYVLLSEMEAARALKRWRDEQVGQWMALKFAADDEAGIGPIHFDKILYSVDLIPTDAAGAVWRINITVSEEFAAMTPVGFRLIDEGGLVWLEGRPDESLQIVGFWEREESLLDRFGQFKLKLVPRV